MIWFIFNVIIAVWAARDSYYTFAEGRNKMGWFLLFVSAFNAAAALAYVFSS